MKTCILLPFVLLTVVSGFSQKKTTSIKKPLLPKSIYSINSHNKINHSFSINNQLNLKSFKFITLDVEDIEDGYFSISFQNLNKKPTKFIYESYMDIYNDLNLKKSFFKLSNLYRFHK
jgi:hypothetical protein